MTSQSDNAYKKVRDAITFGRYSPGERLIEHEACQAFQVGRTPLREALRRLQTEGYVNLVPNRGVTISKLSIDDVKNIYSIIALLEGYATELAVEYLTAEDMKKLDSLHKRMAQLDAKQNFREWTEKNDLFHGLIVKACGNNLLPNLIKGLRNKIYRYRFLSVTTLGQSDKYVENHEKILTALRSKNAKQAGKTMRKHVSDVGKLMIELLRQYPVL
jgi:DNA-binding GntR family transcriptional regulator